MVFGMVSEAERRGIGVGRFHACAGGGRSADVVGLNRAAAALSVAGAELGADSLEVDAIFTGLGALADGLVEFCLDV